MNEQEFATAPIRRLFYKCTLPAMVGIGFSAIYSVTDGIFVGHFLGHEALAAVNLVMPIIMIITALSDLLAASSSVRISILLDQDKKHEASSVFSFCLGLIVLLSTFLGFLGFVFARPIISFMGADGQTAQYAVEYLRVFALFLPTCSLYFSTDNYLRDCGKINLSMSINIVCAVLNILLDWLLIVVLKQGLVGAALASSLSMTIGAIWSIIPFLRKKVSLTFVKGWLSMQQIGKIIANGSSEFFVSMNGSLLSIIINMILLKIAGATAVAAVSIVEYVESLTGMVIYSMINALQPAISYCYGAALYTRMKRLQQVVMIAAAGLSILAMIFLLTGGKWLLPFFVKDGDMALYDMSLTAMHFFALSYLVSWIEMTLSGYMTALERPIASFLMSLAGTMVFPLLCLAIMVPLWGGKRCLGNECRSRKLQRSYCYYHNKESTATNR